MEPFTLNPPLFSVERPTYALLTLLTILLLLLSCYCTNDFFFFFLMYVERSVFRWKLNGVRVNVITDRKYLLSSATMDYRY